MKNNLLIDSDIDDSNPEKPSSEFENIFHKLLSGKASHFYRRANFLFLNVHFWPNVVWK